MPFKIVRNDITKVKADVIVNTANPKPIFSNGTDYAIYQAAGADLLLEERKKIGNIESGNIGVTPAFKLSAKYIIHTVGPVWIDGKHNEEKILHSCYELSLKKATELGCESIAFPLISTGIYGFPKDLAIQVAITAISRFLMQNEMQVSLVVFDGKAFELSGKLFQGVDQFIDENYVKEKKQIEYSRRYNDREEHVTNRQSSEISEENSIEQIEQRIHRPEASLKKTRTVVNGLDDVMNNVSETFQQRLLQLIDERGLTDASVYRKANIDRKLFSKIRCNEEYRPRKKTAVALAIALKLNIEETKDLLARAEIALSPSNKFDLIIEYFISQKVFDVNKINITLFKHNQPILG